MYILDFLRFQNKRILANPQTPQISIKNKNKCDVRDCNVHIVVCHAHRMSWQGFVIPYKADGSNDSTFKNCYTCLLIEPEHGFSRMFLLDAKPLRPTDSKECFITNKKNISEVTCTKRKGQVIVARYVS